jgi:hypothetical protein
MEKWVIFGVQRPDVRLTTDVLHVSTLLVGHWQVIKNTLEGKFYIILDFKLNSLRSIPLCWFSSVNNEHYRRAQLYLSVYYII